MPRVRYSRNETGPKHALVDPDAGRGFPIPQPNPGRGFPVVAA